jgi:hypothetical protein
MGVTNCDWGNLVVGGMPKQNQVSENAAQQGVR